MRVGLKPHCYATLSIYKVT